MKSLKDYVLDESPKMTKKMDKVLEKSNSAQYYGPLKQEVAQGVVAELPNLGLCVTNSYLVYYRMSGIGTDFNVFPLSEVSNVFRTNLVGEYDWDAFYLGVEYNNGTRFNVSRVLRSKKSFTIYDPIIDAVRARVAILNGGKTL